MKLTGLEALAEQSMTWAEPETFDLSQPDGRKALERRITEGAARYVLDPLDAIANDLSQLKYPSQVTPDRLRSEFISGIKEQGDAFGTWVLFPWSHTVVRYPDKDSYRQLRTSRNRDLITVEEQEKLHRAKIAVFGLSVGSNAADMLVRTGIGHRYLLADYDTVAPSNLNRITATGIDLGCSKLDLVARRISKLDPWIEQVHFREGVTAETLRRLSDDPPDVIVEEVDDLAAKARIRRFAKAYGVPLVMATDLGDVTYLDVERHDVEDTPEFNGRIKQQDVDMLVNGELTDAQRSRVLLRLAGLRHMSVRMLDSAVKRGSELAGIPQLGTTASAGGALATIAVRELLLGRRLKSGRYVISPKSVLGLQRQEGVVSTAGTIRRLRHALTSG